VLLGDLQRAARPLVSELEVAPPEVEEARVKEGVGQRERVAQLPRELDGCGRSFDGAVGIAEHPQYERRARVSDDTGAGPETKATRPMLERVEERHRPLEVVQACRNVAEEGEARSHDEMALDPETRVLLLLGQLQ
jgi:hypothetical protein